MFHPAATTRGNVDNSVAFDHIVPPSLRMPATPFHTEGMDEGRNPDSRRGRRGRGRRRPRRERRVRGSSALPMITLVAPIAAQALMVIMLLLERRWLFAAMVAPGMVGCMASAASSLADRRGSSRRDESGTTSHDAAGGRPGRPTDMAGAGAAIMDRRTEPIGTRMKASRRIRHGFTRPHWRS